MNKFINSKINLLDYNQIVFFTGAGMSAESGVPTYRGLGGLWHEYKWEDYACQNAFIKHPEGVLDFHELRRLEALKCIPHSGHKIITQIQDKKPNTVIITQNIDGLHQRSGSTNVLELHGSIIRIKCTVCDFTDNITENFESLPPKCKCGSMLRPDVVWFGESLPQNIWQSAVKEASVCDVMVIVGTSLVVSPANTLPVYAKQNGAILIEVNPEKTVMSNDMDLSIQSTSARILPEILSVLKK